MPNFRDLTNQTFGRFLVLKSLGARKSGTHQGTWWKCRCACGTIKEVESYKLTSGHTKSCGCLSKEIPNRRTHGLRHSPEYQIWAAMRERCNSPGNRHFHNYGGRGIKVCARWDSPTSFQNFIDDMGRRPSPGDTIERKDNNGPYSPENCVWAPRKTQGRNQRTNRLIKFNGETKCLADWAEALGINRTTLAARLNKGIPMERAVSKHRVCV